MKKKKPEIPTLPAPLPKGVTDGDRVGRFPKTPAASRARLYEFDFELWYSDRMGWCIPTLPIGGRTQPGLAPRTYGIRVEDKSLVSMGGGPHVRAQVPIYVTTKNQARLQWLLDLKQLGMEKAGEYRDTLSTRRAQTRGRRDRGWLY